ncbi:MAG: hypothetical protein KIT83_19850 [Bryobacterales bacterium]|nr:hypothetical protein [Bryobacterales bacterium]
MRFFHPGLRLVALLCFLCGFLTAQVSGPYALRFGTPSNEEVHSFCVDSGGNYVTAFTFQGTVTFPGGTNPNRSITSNGQRDNGLVRYDFLGNLQWVIRWGSTTDADRPVAMACGLDGSIYVAGVFEGTMNANPGAGPQQLITSKGGTDAYLLKLNSNGGFVWVRTFGGTAADTPRSLTIGRDGTLAMAMTYGGFLDADPSASVTREVSSRGGLDILVLRLTAAGNLMWASSIGGPTNDGTGGVSIAMDGDSNVWVAGTYTGSIGLDPVLPGISYTSQGGHDLFLAVYGKSGQLLSGRPIQGAGDIQLRPTSLAIDAADTVYLGGIFRQTFDVDPSFTNQRQLSARSNSTDFFLASFTTNYTLRWASAIGGFGEDILSSMRVDRNGTMVVAGRFNSQLALNPGQGNPGVVVGKGLVNATDGFVAKYRTGDGTFVSGFSLGNASIGEANQNAVVAAEIDTMGNVVVAGNLFGADMNFGTNGAEVLRSSAGGSDLFLAAYSWRGTLRVPNTELQSPILRATTNAASFLPAPVVPGSLASLFGLNISTKLPGITKPDIARSIPIGKKLCNTEVVFRSIDSAEEWKAPILFCSDFQVNYQVPVGLPAGYVTLHVTVDDNDSNDMETLVGSDDIGIFMDNAQTGVAAIHFAFGIRSGQKLSPTNPLNACDIVEAYVTGLGATQTTFPADGTPAGGALRTQGDAKFVLFDDGTQGRLPGFEGTPRFVEFTRANGAILYTGLSPEFVGLYQINLRWPNPQLGSTPASLRVNEGTYPVYFEFRGKRSQEFFVTIRYALATSPCAGGQLPGGG